MTRKAAIFSVKGGVGKTSVTIGLSYALKSKGLKIGLVDIDITGPKLPTALGIPKTGDPPKFPRPSIDIATGNMLPLKYDGFEVFSEAFIFGDTPLMLHGGDQTVKAWGQEFKLEGTGLYSFVDQDLKAVQFSPDLDYLLYDLPPSSSDVTLSLFDHLTDIWACIVVCQPTCQSVDDIMRTITLLRKKKVPVLGMVGNMAEAVCPCCGKSYYPFSDAPADLQQFCKDQSVPYLISIPFTPDKALLDKSFAGLAELVLTRKPVNIWKRSLVESATDAGMMIMTKSAAQSAAKEE